MPRKPPSGDQPTLFPLDTDDSPEPEKPLHSTANGDHHAVQDDHSRTPATAPGTARTATANGNGRMASGEKGKARDILAAIRTLKAIEHEQRPATSEEKQALARFAGFGPVALSIFPDPVTGKYKDAGWQAIGEELKT